MYRNKLLLTILAVGIALVLGYLVGTRGANSGPTAPVVRTYQVPPDRAGEVRNALNNLFWKGTDDNSLGHAQLFNGGLVLVRAPEEIQTGIAQLVNQLTGQKAPLRNVIHLDYWLVVGEESDVSNAEHFPKLAPVFSSITKIDGPRHFRVLEHLAANPLNEQKVVLKGSIVNAKLTADLASDQITVSADIASHFGDVESSTRLLSGEYAVIGENSVKPHDVHLRDDDKFKGERDEKLTNVYHVLHAELVK